MAPTGGFRYMIPQKRTKTKVTEDSGNGVVKKVRIGESAVGAEAMVAGEEMGSGGGSGYGNGVVENDEDLHSRQLAVYGRETMRRLFASSVLISGLNGLGAEIAKNLALAGVKSVTLHDEGNVEMCDLSGNFFLSEDDIGKNRAVACVTKLQELNNAVDISALTEELTTEHLSKFQAVVFTDISLDKAFEFDDHCRSHQPPIPFIKTEVRGLFGSVFCDFGPEFTVHDLYGEDTHTGIIASITNGNPATVCCVDDEYLDFQDGDLVVFSEVQGMTELNDGKPRMIKRAKLYSFCIEEDTRNFGMYTKGGIATQVKEQSILRFKSLRDSIREPGNFPLSDCLKFDRPPLLHFAFLALDKFRKEFGRFPAVGCGQDAQRIVEFTASFNEATIDYKIQGKLDEKLLRLFASGSRAVLNPMAAMFGGIVGQEVVKACSGKFHPLYQFFYFDSVESLPIHQLDPKDLKPVNSRYDAQISVFGSKLQKNLRDANVFVVGSGALGCEFLKNLALMGVSCGRKGKLTITDDDVIEKSNLSCQFLFRDWNIGQAKSTVAATAASAINSCLHIDALQNRACPETEHVFHDVFWEGLDVVINALDNVNAWMYMNMRCLHFQKPLLDSGTLGTKCYTQMVIPHLTENYGASRDPPEKQAPMCTIHSFPHNIDHCLTWARSEFEGLLEKIPHEVNSFLSNPTQYADAMKKAGDAQARELLERVHECLEKERCERFEDCITWARQKFEDYFCNRVKQLTFTFREVAAASTGAPAWSSPKRFPCPLEFSATDSSHVQFIMAASILRAVSFGISIPDWAKSTANLINAVSKVSVPEFKPKSGCKIETDEKAINISSAPVDAAAVIEDLLTKLEGCAKKLSPGFKMKPIQLEKDDDTNFHMDLIAGLANMRARNYGIQEVDKFKVKFIVGRIIPPIATSISMAAGLMCLELYKVLAGAHPIEDYRNTFANMTPPMLTMSESLPRSLIEHQLMRCIVWDRWPVEENITIPNLLKWFSDKGLSAYSVPVGSSVPLPRHKGHLSRGVIGVPKEMARVAVACEDIDMNSVDILISIHRNHLSEVDTSGLVDKVLSRGEASGMESTMNLSNQSVRNSGCAGLVPSDCTDYTQTQSATHPYVLFSDFVKDNELIKPKQLDDHRTCYVRTEIGADILSSIYRGVISDFRNNKSRAGRFSLSDLIVSKGNQLSINTDPVFEGKVANLQLDLRKINKLVHPEFKRGIIPALFMKHLRTFTENLPTAVTTSPEALEKYLDILYHHFVFARAMDVYYLVIGLATGFYSLGTEDQAIFLAALNSVPMDLKLAADWTWLGGVNAWPILKAVVEYQKGKNNLPPRTVVRDSLVLGAFLFSRHSEIHGPQNALVHVKDEETASTTTTKCGHVESEDEKKKLVQKVSSPILIFYMMLNVLGEIVAQSIVRIVMDVEVKTPAYITKPWRAYTRGDDSD